MEACYPQHQRGWNSTTSFRTSTLAPSIIIKGLLVVDIMIEGRGTSAGIQVQRGALGDDPSFLCLCYLIARGRQAGHR